MRAILDTNILVSALIAPVGAPGFLYQLWRTGRFALLSCEEQFEEFRRVTRYPGTQEVVLDAVPVNERVVIRMNEPKKKRIRTARGSNAGVKMVLTCATWRITFCRNDTEYPP